jgi:hypothetical protein
MTPSSILLTTSGFIMFATIIAVSYKTGFVAYSVRSATRKDQPKFEIDKTAVEKFLRISVGVFILNTVYGILVFRDTTQMGGILLLSLINTIVISYGVSFWVLLKEKKPNKPR